MLEKLYYNIGGKIKGLAKFIFILGMIASVIAYWAVTVLVSPLAGPIVLVLGALVSFISTWFLYAFGELLFRVTSIDENLRVLSMTTHEQMNRDLHEAEVRARRDAEERARKHTEETVAKLKAQWNSVSQATYKTVDLVGEEVPQTATTVVHHVTNEFAPMDSEMSADFVEEERAKRKAEWDAEMQLRKEAEDRARQVVEERMRRKAEERAQKESAQN